MPLPPLVHHFSAHYLIDVGCGQNRDFLDRFRLSSPCGQGRTPCLPAVLPQWSWGVFADSVEKIAILSKKGRRWGTTVKKVLVLSTDGKPIPMERD